MTYNYKPKNARPHSQESKTNIKTFRSLCYHYKQAMEENEKLKAELEKLKAKYAELEFRYYNN